MLKIVQTFSGFSVNDQAAAQSFYGDKLGLQVDDTDMGLRLKLASGGEVFVYAKPDHTPASFTILNFVVEDIDTAVDELVAQGIEFARYDGLEQDDKGIARGRAVNRGPDIAWFKDPSSNVLSVLQES
jgi:catechol 2,3-dioxygenase-like lactoylglutathione lyase family enzyme